MKIHNVQQNTPEWEYLRAGMPTASAFDRIVTPTGKLSKQSRDYKAWLLAERVMRKPIETKKTSWMDRGTEFESEAVEFLEGVLEVKTERIGFVTNDSCTIGASPDRWVGNDRQAEIKVPAPQTHMGYLIAAEELPAIALRYQQAATDMRRSLSDRTFTPPSKAEIGEVKKEFDEALARTIQGEYKIQTAGQLWITERTGAILLSYSPEGLPPVFFHLKRDEDFIRILGQAVSEFSRDLEESAADLVKRGIIQP